ncbi:hypothetical protein ACHAW5_009147 [Stephanodiscus triporus]|uniref:Tryptophan synthase beta chain-like PALP domain-containing protein n=1 Tax=Stephanodiscus triporus TaxID=2934178 RepID=A0ABD3N5W1_9STRA
MAMTAIVVLLLMPTPLASAFAYRVRQPPRLSTTIMSSSSSSSSSSRASRRRVDAPHPYRPPTYVENALTNAPKNGRLRLANLPTPIHHVKNDDGTRGGADDDGGGGGGVLSRLGRLNVGLYVKRDDATGGTELGGNKLRKLEFLLADALAVGSDSVVTVGGEQSNHCRATAAASRMVGLSPHLILRTTRAGAIEEKRDDIGWMGNILFDRMAGSTIYTCTPGEYTRLGSEKLVESVCNDIRRTRKHNNPYPIPVGGSNGIGTWGYINAVTELMQQMEDMRVDDPDFTLDHVVFATGSGGTAAGIAIGLSLAYGGLGVGHPAFLGESAPRLHAVGVCDSPDYFYRTMSSIADEMGIKLPDDKTTEQFMREAVTVTNGKGRGYAFSSDEELDFISRFAIETGIVLDPVYTGKAMYYFLKDVLEGDPEAYRDKNILFWHTGGSIGLYEKGNELLERLSLTSRVIRINASVVNNGTGGGDA